MSDDVKSIISHQGKIAAKRHNFDNWWQDIAERVMPSDAQFTRTDASGEKRTERLFDGAPVTANERFASVMEDLLTPRTQEWHQLAPQDNELDDNHEVQVYFEEVNDILFKMRNRPKANFASQKHQGYMSIGAFGNSCMFIDETVGAGTRYKQLHMSEVFWEENHQGVIDTLYRKFKLNARQAVMKFGDKLNQKIHSIAKKEPLTLFEFIHCVKPNDDMKPNRQDYTGMPWSSFYVDVSHTEMIDASGFTSWPFAIGRYMLSPNEVYARSPAMAAWPSILTLNEEKKTILRAGQKQVDPPILLQEDGVLEPFNLRAGAINYGAVNQDGRALALPFNSGANIPLGVELMEMEKQHIDDSFLVTVFQILLENQNMTATQVLEVSQQKGTLLAPVMGRQHSEDLGPLIERELDIAAKNGLLPEMPQALADMGGEYKIEYKSPLARAMRAQDGAAIARTLEMLPMAMSIDPTAADVFDLNEAMRELAEINGMPAKLLRSKEVVAAIAEQKAQAMQAQQMAAQAPGLAKAGLDAAKAQEIAG